MLTTAMEQGSSFMRIFAGDGEGGTTALLGDVLYDEIKKEREGASPPTTLGSIFYAFFEKLAEFVGADQAEPSGAAEDDRYLRLRRGPTFQELCNIMAFYWNEFRYGGYLEKQEVEALVRRYLNKAIDDGRVVATFSQEGKRIYRTGESRLERREYYASLTKKERVHYRKYPCAKFTYREDVDSLQRAIENLYW